MSRRHYWGRRKVNPTQKHLDAAAPLVAELESRGEITPKRAAEMVLNAHRDVEDLLFMRRDEEWGLTPELKTAMRRLTNQRMLWKKDRECWVIPDAYRQATASGAGHHQNDHEENR